LSGDAWVQEHRISEAILPRPRRVPKLSPQPINRPEI
jgi:hypothetical protein